MSNGASSPIERVHQLDPDAVHQPDDAVLRCDDERSAIAAVPARAGPMNSHYRCLGNYCQGWQIEPRQGVGDVLRPPTTHRSLLDPDMLLAQHRAVGDPFPRRRSNQKRDVGLGRAHRRHRDVAAKAGIAVLIQIHERRVDEDGIAAACASVGVADQRSPDLNRRARRTDGVSGSKHQTRGR